MLLTEQKHGGGGSETPPPKNVARKSRVRLLWLDSLRAVSPPHRRANERRFSYARLQTNRLEGCIKSGLEVIAPVKVLWAIWSVFLNALDQLKTMFPKSRQFLTPSSRKPFEPLDMLIDTVHAYPSSIAAL